MSRPIDADVLTRLLREQKVKQTGARTEGFNKALNIAISTQQSEWISVDERLPEDDETVREHKDFRLSLRSVLVNDSERGILISNRYRVDACGIVSLDELVTDGWVWSNNAQNVTHWMPLPQPPKENE